MPKLKPSFRREPRDPGENASSEATGGTRTHYFSLCSQEL